jgi:hypothetical protein
MDFSTIAKKQGQLKSTENGQMAYNTINSNLLDLFGTIGALRTRDKAEIEDKFARAFAEDALLATKMLFYAGDIRGLGLGERRTFRICLKWLAMNYPDIARKNITAIPMFNRWDSIFELVGTPCEEDMWFVIDKQLQRDVSQALAGESCSLLAKWMPSENASSKATKALALKAIKALGITPREYRKVLSNLRGYIDVTETKMSRNEWNSINYEAVPSVAMKNYQKAFARRDALRYQEYLASVNKGEKKINSSTLYPYDLVEQYINYRNGGPATEAQWKALPNYVSGENNVLIMADVSGSMYGRPMATSIGLAIYFAERNKGAYHNLYMTFTDQPRFVSIKEGATLRENVRFVEQAGVGYNTNLEAAFNEILRMAVQNSLRNEELPKALLIVSDMEIDNVVSREGLDFVETMKRRFAQYGYKMPKLIMWNVDSRQDTFLTQGADVLHVSGQSTNTFKSILSSINYSAYELMLKVLNDELYSCIEI